MRRKLLFLFPGLAMLTCVIAPSLAKRMPALNLAGRIPAQSNRRIFWLGALFLAVLTGALIPSAVVAASAQEFVSIIGFYHPFWYIIKAFCLSAGTFLIWMGVFYWLADSHWRILFQRLVWILCGIMLVNYMFFGTDLGTLSNNLQYEYGMAFSRSAQFVNLLVVLVAVLALYLFARKYSRCMAPILLTALISISCMSAVSIAQIGQSVNTVLSGNYSEMARIPLSKKGKNVVVLMLDRAGGEFLPYFLNEKSELREQFDGFIYYPNTISFGAVTNIGAPALLGGYEYTPVEMNRRADEPLVSKHNEALKVMPTALPPAMRL